MPKKPKFLIVGLLVIVLLCGCLDQGKITDTTTTTTLNIEKPGIDYPVDAYDLFYECNWFCSGFGSDWEEFLKISGVHYVDNKCTEYYIMPCARSAYISDESWDKCWSAYEECMVEHARLSGADHLKGVNYTHVSKEKVSYPELAEKCRIAEDSYIKGYFVMKGFIDYRQTLPNGNVFYDMVDNKTNVGGGLYLTEFRGLDERSPITVWWVDFGDEDDDVVIKNHYDTPILVLDNSDAGMVNMQIKGCYFREYEIDLGRVGGVLLRK